MRIAVARALLVLLAGTWPAGAEPRTAEIVWQRAGGEAGGDFVAVHGIDPELLERLRSPAVETEWTELFTVQTEEAAAAGLPAVLGSYAIETGALRFSPRFPLRAGESYVARWRPPSAAGPQLVSRFSVPVPALEPTTELLAVYPSADVLPENLLRLYLQFSAPMARGGAASHVRLETTGGEPVEGVFVAPERELWSPDRTRLTLFLDPGRIKRGVGPDLEVGPPLAAGSGYRLVVDAAWPDARGAPLRSGRVKSFTAGEADRTQPDVERWTLTPPAAPRAAVALAFPEPLDRALLRRMLVVLDAEGDPVPGRVTVPSGEDRWSLTPARPWKPDSYRIRIDGALEDVAGNSIRRPFESAIEGGSPSAAGPRFVELTFRVEPR